MKRCQTVWLVTALALVPAAVSGQATLPMGETSQGSTSAELPAEFTVDVGSAGFLTVVVRAAKGGDEDLVLSITDSEYQTLPDARSDQDMGGVMSAEQIVARIPEAGTYIVLVEMPYGYSTAGFNIGATFLATDIAASAPDADGRPSGATALSVGASHEDAIDPSAGDARDWFAITAETSGVLTVLTRATDMEEGDLKLELFRADDFREAFDTSDQDQNGILTNESLNADVVAGETLYVRVTPSFGGGGRVGYRIASGIIPG